MTNRIAPAVLSKAVAEGRVTDASGKVVTTLGQRKPAPVEQVADAPGKPGLAQPMPRIVDTFTLHVSTAGINFNLGDQGRAAWIKMKALVRENVERAWLHADKPAIATPYRHVIQTMGPGKIDPMNIVIPVFKAGVDKLVDLGALVDDTPAWDKGGQYLEHDYRNDVECAKWVFAQVAAAF